MLGYVISFGMVAVIGAFFYIVGPLAKKYRLEAIFAIAAKSAEIVEQETKRPENETEQEKKARQEKMKKDAIEVSKSLAEEYNLKIPSDVILGYAVEAGVFIVNNVKKLTETRKVES